MKPLLAVMFLLFATSAFAQYGGQSMSAQPNVWRPPYHEQHATRQSLRSEDTNLQGGSAAYAAKGDGSMANIRPVPEKPLGDVARAYRTEQKDKPKATKVWDNAAALATRPTE